MCNRVHCWFPEAMKQAIVRLSSLQGVALHTPLVCRAQHRRWLRSLAARSPSQLLIVDNKVAAAATAAMACYGTSVAMAMG